MIPTAAHGTHADQVRRLQTTLVTGWWCAGFQPSQIARASQTTAGLKNNCFLASLVRIEFVDGRYVAGQTSENQQLLLNNADLQLSPNLL